MSIPKVAVIGRPNKKQANIKDEPYQSQWTGTTLDLTNPKAQEYLYNEIKREVLKPTETTDKFE